MPTVSPAPFFTILLQEFFYFGDAHLRFRLRLDLVMSCLPNLSLGFEQGGEIDFPCLVSAQRGLETQFGLRQQAGRRQHLGAPCGFDAGKIFGKFAENLVRRRVLA